MKTISSIVLLIALAYEKSAFAQDVNPNRDAAIEKTVGVTEAPIITRGSDREVEAVMRRRVSLDFEAAEPNLTLHVVKSESQMSAYSIHGAIQGVSRTYERLCTAPCRVELPQGSYRMALSKGDGPIVDFLSPLDIDGPTKFRTRYRSNEKTRSVGWGIMGVGNGIGLLLSAVSINGDDIDEGILLAGTGLAITTTLLALFLISKNDEATIERVD